MAFLGYQDISLAYFQDFDHGKAIPHYFPKELKVEIGDYLLWDLAQFSGSASIVVIPHGPITPDGKRRVMIRKS